MHIEQTLQKLRSLKRNSSAVYNLTLRSKSARYLTPHGEDL